MVLIQFLRVEWGVGSSSVYTSYNEIYSKHFGDYKMFDVHHRYKFHFISFVSYVLILFKCFHLIFIESSNKLIITL